VGMDVVKTNIEKIGGAVELYNRPGKGLTLRIKIPLTLAIIPALVIATGGEQFAIPQVNLLELVRLEGEQARHAVEHIHGTPVYRLRGNLLALTYLNDELGVKGQGEDGVLNIVVLQADDCTFGLVVDAVNDTEEIVVKPLGRELSDLDVYAGTTIMGDGHVALILDVMGLARRAGIAGANGAADLLQSSDAAAKGPDNDQQALLLVRSGESGQLAIPLSAVARLEELPRDAIERASGLDVMQYRGAIMPLVHVSHALGLGSYDNDDDLLQIVVYSHGERRIGIVVDQILDIASEIVSFENVAHRHGILGAAVVSGKVTDIVDMRALIETIDPTFFDGVAA
ncbi:MAG: chemotaxis protein CheW, partial [Myxococcales bacterium]|nr:chemotaxis protein CheW [Myxococcales bacterium]